MIGSSRIEKRDFQYKAFIDESYVMKECTDSVNTYWSYYAPKITKDNIHLVDPAFACIHPALAELISIKFLPNQEAGEYDAHIILKKYNQILSKQLLSSKEEWDTTRAYTCILGIASGLGYLLDNSMNVQLISCERVFVDHNYFPKMICTEIYDIDYPEGSRNILLMAKNIKYQFALLAIEILTGEEPDIENPIIPSIVSKKMKVVLKKCLSKESEDISFLDICKILVLDPEILPDSIKRLDFEAYAQSLEYAGIFAIDDFVQLPYVYREYMKITNRIIDNPDKKNFPKGERLYCEELAKGFRTGKDQYIIDNKAELYFTILAVEYGTLDPDEGLRVLMRVNPPDSYYERVIAPLCYKSKRLSIQSDDLTVIDQPLLVPEKYRGKFKSKDPNDQMFIYRSYLEGINGFPKDSLSARKHLKMAVALHSPEALDEAGNFYLNGFANIPNYEKAIKYYKEAKECGVEKPDYFYDDIELLAKANKERPKYEDNLTFLDIAHSYLLGINNYPKNLAAALEYYEKAAEEVPNIFAFVGDMFRKGHMFPKNIKKAIKYYHKGNIAGDKRSKWFDYILDIHKFVPHERTPVNDMLTFLENNYTERTCSRCFDDVMTIPRCAYLRDICNFPTIFNEIYYRITPSIKKEYYRRIYNRDEYVFDPKICYFNSPKATHNSYSIANVLRNNSVEIIQVLSTYDYLEKCEYYGQVEWIHKLKGTKCVVQALILPPNEIIFHDKLYNWNIDELDKMDQVEDIFKRNTLRVLKMKFPKFDKKVVKTIEDCIIYAKEISEDSLTGKEALVEYERLNEYIKWSSPKVIIAEELSPDNSYEIGMNYLLGNNGYPVNYKKALDIIKFNIDINPEAAYYTNYLSLNAVGTKQLCPTESAKYFRRGAGDVKSQLLNTMFEDLKSQINRLFGNLEEQATTTSNFSLYKSLNPVLELWRKKLCKKIFNNSIKNEVEVLCKNDPNNCIHAYYMNSKEYIENIKDVALLNIDMAHFIYKQNKFYFDLEETNFLLDIGLKVISPTDIAKRFKILSKEDAKKEEYKTMIKYYGNINDPLLQKTIGRYYADGVETPSSLKKAKNYFNLSAMENPRSLLELAKMTLKEKKQNMANKLFKYVLEKHIDNYRAGEFLYYYGYFQLEYDVPLALETFKVASETYDDPRSQYMVTLIYFDMLDPKYDNSDVLKDEKIAVTYLKYSCRHGYDKALLLFSKLCIKNLYGLKLADKEILNTIQKASYTNLDAADYYGQLLILGLHGICKPEKGTQLLLKIEEHGAMKAGFYLFKVYRLEENVSAKHLGISARQGYRRAMVRLAYGACKNEELMDECERTIIFLNDVLPLERPIYIKESSSDGEEEEEEEEDYAESETVGENGAKVDKGKIFLKEIGSSPNKPMISIEDIEVSDFETSSESERTPKATEEETDVKKKPKHRYNLDLMRIVMHFYPSYDKAEKYYKKMLRFYQIQYAD